VRVVTSKMISTEDLIGLICGITVWIIALIYFHTRAHVHQLPQERIMGWSPTNSPKEKVLIVTTVDNKEGEKFKKTVNFPGDEEKFPEGTPNFSDPDISQSSESVNANYRSGDRYPVDGLVL